MPSGPSVDWQESRRRCGDVLKALIGESEESRKLAELLSGASYFVGGDEHHLIRVDSEPGKVFKLTYGDNFGCGSYFSTEDPELTGKHFHATGNANPFFYLERWVYLNSMSAYRTRYEGILPPANERHLPRFCVSQPVLPPQTATRENPQEQEIEQALLPFGFRKISQDAFLNGDNGVLLTDAAPRNVRVIDGVPIPFDAIAQIAPDAVIEWAGR